MMSNPDILVQLRIDPGLRILGQLLQDREAAAHEIKRLRAEIERLGTHRAPTKLEPQDVQIAPDPSPKMLIRLTELCGLLGVSRSTIYKWLSTGTFPPPLRIGARAVRWRVDEVEKWRDAL